ncbi:MAG: hypothetical protein O2954_02450 [bacterium]|nr:hypothetical protein [bacterium]
MRRVSVNAFLLTLEKAAHLLGAMLMLVLVARMLGVQGLADYGLIIGLTAFFVPLLDVGLNNRLIKAAGSGAHTACSDAVSYKLAASGPALLLMVLSAGAMNASQEVLITVVLIGASTVAMSLGDAFNSVFKGLQRPGFSAVLMGGLNVLLLGAGALVMKFGYGLVGLGACFLLSRGVYAGCGYLLVRRFVPGLSFRPVFRKDLIVDGLQHLPAVYFLGNLLHLTYIVTYLTSTSTVAAEYAIGYRLASALFVLVGASLEAFLPALTQRVRNVSDLRGILLRASAALGILSLLVSFLVQVAARPAILAVLGAPYVSAAYPAGLLAWTVPPFVLCGLAHTALLAMDRQRSAVWVLLALLVAGTGLGAVVAPFWGPAGTALAPTATVCIFGIGLWGMVFRKTA